MNEHKFSYAKLAVCSVGAASLVLLLSAVLIGVLKPAPVFSLVIAVAGVVGSIAAMGVVSKRITRAAFPPDAERTDQDQ